MIELFGVQLGTIFQGGTLAAMLAILGIIVKWQLGLRKLSIEAQQVHVNARTARNADDADIRDHYAEELGRVIKRQHDCEAREEALRTRVAELENNVLSLIRIITQASADKVLSLGPEVPHIIRDMAERIQLGRHAK